MPLRSQHCSTPIRGARKQRMVIAPRPGIRFSALEYFKVGDPRHAGHLAIRPAGVDLVGLDNLKKSLGTEGVLIGREHEQETIRSERNRLGALARGSTSRS
jgi:hypothetical protein